jgi:hypothetical protein
VTNPSGEFGIGKAVGPELATMQVGIGVITIAGGAIDGNRTVMAAGEDLSESSDLDDLSMKGHVGVEDDGGGDEQEEPRRRTRWSSKVYVQSLAAKTAGKFVGGMAGEAVNIALTHPYLGAAKWFEHGAIAGGEQAATQFRTGLVFEDYEPKSLGGRWPMRWSSARSKAASTSAGAR